MTTRTRCHRVVSFHQTSHKFDNYMTKKHTPIAEIGEFGLIERIKKKCNEARLSDKIAKQIILSIDDDASITEPSTGMMQLTASDLLIEGVHFDLTYTSMKHLGWKLMVVNLSDIAAMGGVPTHAIISIALPAKISVEMVDELYDGILQAAQTYTCAIIGGDTSTSLGNTVLSATITGEAPVQFIKRLNGAKPGDKICVTGNLGLSHAGLKILLREKQRFIETQAPEGFQSQLQKYSFAVSKHLAPKARFDISTITSQKEWVHAMIDISDGLVSDVRHVCKQSGVGALLYENAIPLDPLVGSIAEEFNENALDYALFGGEEFELLFTIDSEYEQEISDTIPGVTVIGEINEDKETVSLQQTDGTIRNILSGGYEHFKK